MSELSIIIASYNRAQMLRTCLESLARQTQPANDFEVIVIVDGSTDDTQDMLAHLAVPFALRVLFQQNSGQAAACNAGIAQAQSQYCLFLDDDLIPSPDLVVEHLRIQRQHNGVVAVGHLDTRVSEHADRFTCYVADSLNQHYARTEQGNRPPSFRDCYSGNLSVPRASLLAIGGFAEDLPRTYDIELGYRLTAHGLSVVYLPLASARQQYVKKFRAIARDAEGEGTASMRLFRRHPGLLPHLPLGAFGEATWREQLFRRILLRLDVGYRFLEVLSRLLSRYPDQDAWYRAVYRYFYWRGVRKALRDDDTWHRLTTGTVILMYHALGHPGETASRYLVPGHAFSRQLAWLKWSRYHVLGLEEFLQYRREYRLPPARSIVLTLDDGYADNQIVGVPLLRRFGFPATIFLISHFLGGKNSWDHDGELAGRPLLSVEDTRAALAAGMTCGVHTRTHPRLTDVTEDRAWDEIFGARADLEEYLQRAVTTFAYPYGKHDRHLEQVVTRAGFLGACTIVGGKNYPATSPFTLRRVEVFGTDSLIGFALLLCRGSRRSRHTWWGRRGSTAL